VSRLSLSGKESHLQTSVRFVNVYGKTANSCFSINIMVTFSKLKFLKGARYFFKTVRGAGGTPDGSFFYAVNDGGFLIHGTGGIYN
jgi:hypothetical protein